MSEIEYKKKIDWFRLGTAQSIGPVTFKRLLAKFGGASQALEALPEFSRSVGRTAPLRIATIEQTEGYFAKCKKAGVEIIASYQQNYPARLRAISDNPPFIHAKGNLNLLQRNALAVVGARNASMQGLAFTNRIVNELSKSGFVIVSGLARGIDTAAHKAALAGGTIAVLGSGIDLVYPEENHALYQEIAERGLLISEFFLGKEPRPQSFTYRNRIIAGLADKVLVMEAALKSGSLQTAQYASQQGRDVFAVPGHPYDIRAAGANYLIKNGAYLLENANSVLDHCKNSYPVQLFDEKQDMLKEEPCDWIAEDCIDFLLQNLGVAPIEIAEVIKISPFTIPQVQAALSQLELAGQIEIEQNYVRRVGG